MSKRVGGSLLYLTFTDGKVPWWMIKEAMLSLSLKITVMSVMRSWLTAVRDEGAAVYGRCLRRGNMVYLTTLSIANSDGLVRFGDTHTSARISSPSIPELFGAPTLRPLFDSRFSWQRRHMASRKADDILNDDQLYTNFNNRAVVGGSDDVIRFLTGTDGRELYILCDWLQDHGAYVDIDAMRRYAETDNRAAAAVEIIVSGSLLSTQKHEQERLHGERDEQAGEHASAYSMDDSA